MEQEEDFFGENNNEENEKNEEEMSENGLDLDTMDNGSTPPQDETPVPGTPGTPTTPVYLTPSKVYDSPLSTIDGRLESVTKNLSRDLFPEFLSRFSEVKKKELRSNNKKTKTDVRSDHGSGDNYTDQEGHKTKSDDQQKHKEMTDYSSAASKGSSLGFGNLGFIATEYFVRDVLFVLKSCVEQLSSALVEEDVAGYEDMMCSVPRSSVKQHSIR